MKKLFLAAALLALAVPAAMAKNDALSLVPNDAVTVGVVHLTDLRTSPLGATLFRETDKISTDGDAEKFLRDAGMKPSTDIDTIVVATTPRTALGSDVAVLVALDGRFTVALWATDNGDSLKLGAFGLSSDTETLGLLEDTLRGALSAMRLAVQDKQPDMVPVLRRFNVARTNDSVTITGSVPAETFRTWSAKNVTR